MDLKTKAEEITGIGPTYAHKLKKLGIEDVEDLLMYLPRRWVDFSNIVPIAKLRPNESYSVHGSVWQVNAKRSRNGRSVIEVIINDSTGSLKAVWFNQPFLINNIKEGDDIYLAGKVEWNYGTFSMVSPSYEKASSEEELTHVGRIVPIYPETEGISSKWLRGKIKPMMKYIYSIKDFLPDQIKREEGIVDLAAAIRQMHFPENPTLLKKAKDRFDFDEMFLMQLAVLGARKKLKSEKAIAVSFAEQAINKFVQDLPFDLTRAQRKAAWEIIQDMAKAEPMNRLLQGDVGSGKTVVAAMAILNVAASGAQTVLLAPTEILAKQHFDKIGPMLESFGLEIALLTGSTKKAEKEEIAAKIYEGEVKVVVGTHAVLEKEIKFWRLGLAIVDEQHRFGVEQRNALRKESSETKTIPHFLSMTATPIPRTLTLTLYGDLDVSVLDEMPAGRQKIITKLVPRSIKEETYKFIERELKNGRQAFVVCPLIGEKVEESENDGEETEKGEVTLFDAVKLAELEKKKASEDIDNERKSVLQEYEHLKTVFSEYKVAYLHGKMAPAEKEQIMREFSENNIQVLISTSVIEVGIDIPNATIMVIEDADRFGLAQLHQFRGRVGRGKHQSYCFLFTKSAKEETIRRLRALADISDGFKLAGVDLEIRGPGDFIGRRQHGLPDIKMKNLLNTQLIKKCRDAAGRFLEKNKVADFPALSAKLEKYDEVLYLE